MIYSERILWDNVIFILYVESHSIQSQRNLKRRRLRELLSQIFEPSHIQIDWDIIFVFHNEVKKTTYNNFGSTCDNGTRFNNIDERFLIGQFSNTTHIESVHILPNFYQRLTRQKTTVRQRNENKRLMMKTERECEFERKVYNWFFRLCILRLRWQSNTNVLCQEE